MEPKETKVYFVKTSALMEQTYRIKAESEEKAREIALEGKEEPIVRKVFKNDEVLEVWESEL